MAPAALRALERSAAAVLCVSDAFSAAAPCRALARHAARCLRIPCVVAVVGAPPPRGVRAHAGWERSAVYDDVLALPRVDFRGCVDAGDLRVRGAELLALLRGALGAAPAEAPRMMRVRVSRIAARGLLPPRMQAAGEQGTGGAGEGGADSGDGFVLRFETSSASFKCRTHRGVPLSEAVPEGGFEAVKAQLAKERARGGTAPGAELEAGKGAKEGASAAWDGRVEWPHDRFKLDAAVGEELKIGLFRVSPPPPPPHPDTSGKAEDAAAAPGALSERGTETLLAQLRLPIRSESGVGGGGTTGGRSKAATWHCLKVPPPPLPRTKWTRRVPHPVPIGHAACPAARTGGGRGRRGARGGRAAAGVADRRLWDAPAPEGRGRGAPRPRVPD